jgi:hypothetical protein
MGRSVSSKGEGAELIPNRGGFWRKILDRGGFGEIIPNRGGFWRKILDRGGCVLEWGRFLTILSLIGEVHFKKSINLGINLIRWLLSFRETMAAVGVSSEGALPLYLNEWINKNGSGKMWHIALGPKGKRSRTRIFIGTDGTTLTLDKIRSALATHKWPSVGDWPKPKEVSKRVMILLQPLRPGKTATLKRTAKQAQKYANIFDDALTRLEVCRASSVQTTFAEGFGGLRSN